MNPTNKRLAIIYIIISMISFFNILIILSLISKDNYGLIIYPLFYFKRIHPIILDFPRVDRSGYLNLYALAIRLDLKHYEHFDRYTLIDAQHFLNEWNKFLSQRIEGTIQNVFLHLLVLKLRGTRSFFDSIIRIDKILAVEYQARES